MNGVSTGCGGCGAIALLDARGYCRACRDDDADDERSCVGCGCTDDNACPGGCDWVAANLCSRCV